MTRHPTGRPCPLKVEPAETAIDVEDLAYQKETGTHTRLHRRRIDLVLDCAEPAKLVGFWGAALDYREYYVADDFAVLVPKEGNASPLVLQGVPEPKAGKNRMHLDIVVDDIESEIARLQALGAHRLDEGQQSFGDTKWVRMSDPEHNEFCVCTGVDW